jgi:hypothetical protein
MVFFLSVQPYFFSYLVVAHNYSSVSAGYITQTFSVSCTVAVLLVSIIIKYSKSYKPYLLAGTVVYINGVGMMLYLRKSNAPTSLIVLTQTIVGIGGGFITAPAQLGVQASVIHQDVASATAIFLTMTSLGGAVGSAISGGIWSRLLKSKLLKYLPDSVLPDLEKIFGDFQMASAYEMWSPEREAITRAYDETMHMLLVVALCVCAILPFLAMGMKAYRLDEVDLGEDRGVIIGQNRLREQSEPENSQQENKDERINVNIESNTDNAQNQNQKNQPGIGVKQ